jgi:hypothetical protein
MHVKSKGSAKQVTIRLRCLHPFYEIGATLRRFPANGDPVDIAPTTSTRGLYEWVVPGGKEFYKVDALATSISAQGSPDDQVFLEVATFQDVKDPQNPQDSELMPVVTSTLNPEKRLAKPVVKKSGNTVVNTKVKYRDFVVNIV